MSDQKVQIINPPNKLKAQVDDGKPTKGLDPNLLAKAEKAVEDLKPQMENHVKSEVDRLNALMGQVSASQGHDKGLLDQMYAVSFELKGQGTSAGFNLVTRFGDSLCRYIEAVKQSAGSKELAIMKAHVDSITVVTARNIKGDSNPIGMAIVAELEKVVGRPT